MWISAPSGTVRRGRAEADKLLQTRAAAQSRSVSGQLKHCAPLALIAEDNPDLGMSMIPGILEGQPEVQAGLAQPYQWRAIEQIGSWVS